MEDKKLKECGFTGLSTGELQMRGGISWKDIMRLARYIEDIINFIDDYKEEMERGFKKGWRMF